MHYGVEIDVMEPGCTFSQPSSIDAIKPKWNGFTQKKNEQKETYTKVRWWHTHTTVCSRRSCYLTPIRWKEDENKTNWSQGS